MKIFRIISFIIACLLCINLCSCSKNGENGKKHKREYKTATVIQGDLNVIITSTGVVKSNTQIDVKSEIGGKVIKLLHNEGDVVEKGDILAIIDDTQQRQKYIQTNSDYNNNLSQVQQAKSSLALQQSITGNLIASKQTALNKAELACEQARESFEDQKEISQAQIDNARARYDTVQKQFEEVLAGSRKQEIAAELERLNQAEATMKNSKKELDRQRELFKKDFVSQQAVDTAEKDFSVAQAQYYAQKENYDMILEGSRSEAIAISKSQLEESLKSLEYQKTQAEEDIATKRRTLELAQSDVNQAEIALQDAIGHLRDIEVKKEQVMSAQALLDKSAASRSQALDDLSKTKIISPMKCIIVKMNVAIGDVVASQTMSSASGTTLMTIADLNDMYAEANVDESDIGRVFIGLPVTLHAAAYPDLYLPSTIFHITPQTVQIEKIPTFLVRTKIGLDKIDKKSIPKGKKRYELFFPGMSVDVDLHVDSRKNVLQLPIEAISQKSGKKFVTLIKDNNTFEDRDVKLGLANSTMVEIISGVSVGDDVKIPVVERPTPAVMPGGPGSGGGGGRGGGF